MAKGDSASLSLRSPRKATASSVRPKSRAAPGFGLRGFGAALPGFPDPELPLVVASTHAPSLAVKPQISSPFQGFFPLRTSHQVFESLVLRLCLE